MAQPGVAGELTESLEDYLETIYELVRDNSFARVKDIARARGVRPGSVSPAMRRLSDLGLVRYERREYIGLTPEGEEVARRVVARHQVLVRLFGEVLRMGGEAAQKDACAMEHSLSIDAVDRLVRFFEYLRVCPEAADLLERFHACSLVHGDVEPCGRDCVAARPLASAAGTRSRRLCDLVPGERCTVRRIEGPARVRRGLLEMGVMPDLVVEVDRVTPSGDLVWVRLGGFRISLSREEAEAVRVATA